MSTSMSEKLREWQHQGWTAEKTNGNHLKLKHRDARGFVIAASTPSDHRSVLNTEALMRRQLRPIESNNSEINVSDESRARTVRRKAKAATGRVVKIAQFDMFARKFQTRTRMPERGQWVTDADILPLDVRGRPICGLSQCSPEEIAARERAEALRAWQFSILRLRASGASPDVIIPIRARFRTDPAFRSDAVSKLRRHALQFEVMKRRVREGKPLGDILMEMTKPVGKAPAPSGFSTGGVHLAIAQDLPTRIETRKTVEDVLREMHLQLAAAEDEVRAEQRVRMALNKEMADLRATHAAQMKEVQYRRSLAEAARDDFEDQLLDAKVRLRQVVAGKAGALEAEVMQQMNELERRLTARIVELEARLDDVSSKVEAPRKLLRRAAYVPAAPETPDEDEPVVVDGVGGGEPQPVAWETFDGSGTAIAVGRRLREVRVREGMSMAQFGSRLGVSGVTISNWEKGKSPPKDASVDDLSRKFGVNSTWLLTGQGSPRRPGRRAA